MNKKIKEMIYQSKAKLELLYTDKYEGYRYYVVSLGTHPTAYVEIPKGDILYGENYNDISFINVHGGLTYSRNELKCAESNNWFIGWDYAHYDDYVGYYETISDSVVFGGKRWTTEEIIEDCKDVISQIVAKNNQNIDGEK